MAEENKTEVSTEQTTEPTEPNLSNSDVRNSELFQKTTRKLKELQDQISAKESAEQQAREEAERKQLEAKGEYETLISRMKEQQDAVVQKHQRELTERDLKLALSNAGLTNPIALNGAVAGFNGTADDINEYVTKLHEEHKDLFSSKQKLSALATGNPSARTGGEDWDKVRDEIKNPNTTKDRANEINEKVMAYMQEHGKLPF